ncbi:MAG: thioesterase family protein [Kangiellaceae bacterium]|nr:thioesterase family protein [Kangiellaceae bacterium]MCW9000051.1 thioesterase family protein [Kangiellaceae bacterium]MCW9017931.1 thioesterase family protein [Kangiellaceae bacterium]
MISEIVRCLYLNKKNRNNKNFAPKGIFEPTRRTFRVGFRDIDFNFHLNNARYMHYMEKGRWDHPVQTGSIGVMLKHKVNFIVAGLEITYIRELPLFKKFEMETHYVGFDDKYFYLEQKFVVGEKLFAHGLVKAVFIKNRKVMPPDQLLDLVEHKTPDIKQPKFIENWKRLAELKRDS